jgi:hypothetical protein
MLVLGVTGWLLQVRHTAKGGVSGRGLYRRITVSDRVPLNALVGMEYLEWSCDFGERQPVAETSPVLAELIGIGGITKNRNIGMSINQTLHFGIRKTARIISGQQENRELVMIGREEHPNVYMLMKGCLQRRRAGVRNNLDREINIKTRRWTLPYIDSSSSNLKVVSKFGWICKRIPNPTPLVNLKIVPYVTPLKNSYSRVDYSGYKSESLQPVLLKEESFYLPPQPYSPFPPWRGGICGLFGIAGICWGWRNKKHPGWGVVSLIFGISMWFYACLVLLPWSTQF